MSKSKGEPISQYAKAIADQQQQPCRTCGTCPTCGNRPAPQITQPYTPYWPQWPQPYTYPQITWGKTFTSDKTYYTGDIVGASGGQLINPTGQVTMSSNPNVSATASTVPSSFIHKGVGPESQYTATNEASAE